MYSMSTLKSDLPLVLPSYIPNDMTDQVLDSQTLGLCAESRAARSIQPLHRDHNLYSCTHHVSSFFCAQEKQLLMSCNAIKDLQLLFGLGVHFHLHNGTECLSRCQKISG